MGCIYNIIRLMIFPSKYIAREVYIGRIFTNFIFLVQCQLFTKVAWDAAIVRETLPSSHTFPPSLEDEFKELRKEDERFYNENLYSQQQYQHNKNTDEQQQQQWQQQQQQQYPPPVADNNEYYYER